MPSPRELFGLGTRLLGLWMFVSGIVYVGGYLDYKLGYARDNPGYSSAGNLIYATLYFMMAALFLLWTKTVVNWTYGDESPKPEGAKIDEIGS